MLPLIDRGCHHWMLPLFEINVHQVGMLPLVERGCNYWIIPLVEINMDQDLPLVDSGNLSLPIFDSGNLGPMYTSKHACLPLVERDGWKLKHGWLPYQRD